LSDDFALAARAPAASEKQGSRNAVSRPGEKRLILRALAFKGIQDRRVFQATPVDPIMRSFILLLTCLELAAQMAAQAGTPHFAQPMPMPADRSEDSYAIYSQLLKSGPIEWRDVSRRHWLIEDTTNATPLDMACHAAPGVNSIEINPHEVVQAPKNRQTEWNEVLTDYDQHCHDVIQLDVQSFRTELPVRLLNTEDKHSFMRDPGNRLRSSPMVRACTGSRRSSSMQTTRWRWWRRACGAARYAGTGRGWCWSAEMADGR
jgi:hypothetical protein